MKTLSDSQYFIQYRNGEQVYNNIVSSPKALSDRLDHLRRQRRKVIYAGPANIKVSYNASQNILSKA